MTVLENVATGERVRLQGLEGLRAHLGRWLESGDADEANDPEAREDDDR